MHFALLGTRGVPARYGGFETAAEEIGRRLVEKGHDVTVYCRGDAHLTEYLGMSRVVLPSVRSRSFETLSHSLLSATHASRLRPAAAVLFNAANSPFIPLLRLARIPTALHLDGLEWLRGKWGRAGRLYYRLSEAFGALAAEACIADSDAIARYHRLRYGVTSRVLAYGAPIVDPPPDAVIRAGLEPGAYVLIVARMEPENHVLESLRGAIASATTDSIVVVGAVPYQSDYADSVARLGATDPRVRLLGAVWDQELLDALYAHARVYLHGHSVGGTNPSLLRAMGAGAPVAAFDVVFNREVLGDGGLYWDTPDSIRLLLDSTPRDDLASVGVGARTRAGAKYRWDDVADGYEALLVDIASRRRRPMMGDLARSVFGLTRALQRNLTPAEIASSYLDEPAPGDHR